MGQSCQGGACSSAEPRVDECASDQGCAAGERCVQGRCESIEGFCQRNSDCPEGQLCERETLRCVAAPTEDDAGVVDPPGEDTSSAPRDVAPSDDADSEPGDGQPDAVEADAPEETDALEDAEADVTLPMDADDEDVTVEEDAVEDVALTDTPLEPQDVLEDVLDDAGVDDAGVDDAGMADAPEQDAGPPPTPQRGIYEYTRVPIGGMREAVRVAFHPDGQYAIILNNTNIVHVLDWETQEATRFDLTPPDADRVVWFDLAFDPSGEFALLVGAEEDGDASEGVIYRFDDDAWRSLNNQEVIFSVYEQRSAHPLVAVEYPWEGGDPIFLERRSSPNVATLRGFNPIAGQWNGFATSETSDAACDDFAFANNEFGEPGMLVVCGQSGTEVLYYTEIGDIGEWRRNPGNNNLGNVSRVAAYPGGDYALIVSWSGRSVYRFELGQLNDYSDAPRYSRLGIWSPAFQPNGRRALIVGRAGISPSRGTTIEYRHDLYDCVNTDNDCDLTEVSIPNFDAPPWNADRNERLNEAAFHPGCDGGLLVGGYSNFNGSSGLVARFQIVGGDAVPCVTP